MFSLFFVFCFIWERWKELDQRQFSFSKRPFPKEIQTRFHLLKLIPKHWSFLYRVYIRYPNRWRTCERRGQDTHLFILLVPSSAYSNFFILLQHNHTSCERTFFSIQTSSYFYSIIILPVKGPSSAFKRLHTSTA